MRRYIFAALLLMLGLVLVAGLVGCLDGIEVTTTDTSEDSPGETDVADDDDLGTRGNPIPVGTPVEIGDWEVTVTDVDTDADDVIAAASEFNEPPIEGSRFVLVTVSGTYNGENSGNFWMDMWYQFVGSGGNTYDSGGENMATTPNPISDAGDAFNGASVSGDMVFEVPVDQIEDGVVEMWSGASFDDTKVYFGLE
ncbi:MAG: DUF4352 domain-containing protein [Coriobacteriia bacterium]|nr:DUF4352 domain-containing protein [Coriobacteriia bacterium]